MASFDGTSFRNSGVSSLDIRSSMKTRNESKIDIYPTMIRNVSHSIEKCREPTRVVEFITILDIIT